MISKDEMRAIIREEVRREIRAASRRISGDSKCDDENEYDEVDYDYLVRTNQHLDI